MHAALPVLALAFTSSIAAALVAVDTDPASHIAFELPTPFGAVLKRDGEVVTTSTTTTTTTSTELATSTIWLSEAMSSPTTFTSSSTPLTAAPPGNVAALITSGTDSTTVIVQTVTATVLEQPVVTEYVSLSPVPRSVIQHFERIRDLVGMPPMDHHDAPGIETDPRSVVLSVFPPPKFDKKGHALPLTKGEAAEVDRIIKDVNKAVSKLMHHIHPEPAEFHDESEVDWQFQELKAMLDVLNEPVPLARREIITDLSVFTEFTTVPIAAKTVTSVVSGILPPAVTGTTYTTITPATAAPTSIPGVAVVTAYKTLTISNSSTFSAPSCINGTNLTASWTSGPKSFTYNTTSLPKVATSTVESTVVRASTTSKVPASTTSFSKTVPHGIMGFGTPLTSTLGSSAAGKMVDIEGFRVVGVVVAMGACFALALMV